ncbi:MAG TPA: winged helix-turn-helix domain-containing protein [Candidatus Methylomirabilis sp.]|nr:winged helix-turn-helix domain-containing protein [Candidatus Methylomirabilis sp.]
MKATYPELSRLNKISARDFAPAQTGPEASAVPVNRSEIPNPMARFGAFEVDLEARELRKHGLRMRLEEKPFLILESLLQNAGRVITRQALREKLWPDTHVRYDQNLNTAVNKLRELLGDSAASPRFIETLPRLGYRFIAPVVKPDESAPSTRPAAARRMLAVLPFENICGDDEQEFFADGLAEEMISHLGQLNPRQFGVIARTSTIQYKGTKKSVSEIAAELKVGYILEGTVRCSESGVRITVQLIDARDQTHLWSASYDRELRHILSVQADIAREVGSALATELLPKHRTADNELNPAAHEAYLRGRYFFGKRTEDGLKKAIASFETALSIEPSCARSCAGIADCYSMLCWYGALAPAEAGARSAAAARRAIEHDPALSEPHASLALALFWYEWNWSSAEKEFLRAVELNPSYAAAHHWHAAYLNAMGRFEEAQAAQMRARELDPHSLMLNMAAADSLFFTRNYDAATKHLLALLEQAPNFLPAHFNLGRVYVQTGMFEPASVAFEKAVSGSRNHVALPALAHAYALAGRTSEARVILTELKQEIAGRYIPAPMLARIHLGLGEPELALDCLEQGLAERSYWMVFLKTDPVYDPLRAHPRFLGLLDEMRLTV